MATLTGNTVASTYKQLLKVTSEGIGADASAKYIEDGLGTDSALSISTTRVGIGVADPDHTLEVFSTAAQLKLSYDADSFATFAVDANNDVTIKTAASGGFRFQATTDTVDYFQVLDADGGTAIFNVDATNERIGIGTAAPTYALDVVGDIGVSGGIYHNDDTDTAMHFGVDNVAFVVGGAAMLLLNETTQNEVVINEDQGDIDFRVESDGATHALFVQASDGSVGIGEAVPLGLLHVKSADSGASVNGSANELVIEGSGNSGITIASGNTNEGFIMFADDGSELAGLIGYKQGDNYMEFRTNATEAMRIDSSGNVLTASGITHLGDTDTQMYMGDDVIAFIAGNVAMLRMLENDSQDEVVINEDGADVDFRVETTAGANGLFVQGSSGNVGIGTAAPTARLDLVGADSVVNMLVTDSITNSASKEFRMGIRNFLNAEEPTAIMYVDSGGGGGTIRIGGGTSSMNAIESIKFYTAADATTVTGTVSMVIDNNSRISLGNNDSSGGATNTIFGYLAGDKIAIGGTDNTLIGKQAGNQTTYGITTGDYNTAVGSSALGASAAAHITGSSNTAIGYNAMLEAQGAVANNTAVGATALQNVTTGSSNVAIGISAGASLTTIAETVFIGAYAGDAVTTTGSGQDGTVAIGANALGVLTSGAKNVAVGYRAGFETEIGDSNIAIGYKTMIGDAGLQNDNNIAIGSENTDASVLGAMSGQWTGVASTNNIAIGTGSMIGAMNGALNNTAVGYGASSALTTGDNNTVLGHTALTANLTGSYNTAIGATSLDACTGVQNTAVGWASGGAIIGGQNNTCLGTNAGNNITSGSQNVCIGDSATVLTVDGDNQIVIGYGTTGKGVNTVTLGNDDVTDVYMASDSGAIVHSGALVNGLSAILLTTGTLAYATHTISKLKYVTVSADAQTLTLPAVQLGAVFIIVNIAADGGALLTISPNGSDKFATDIAGGVGTNDKDIINTKATQNQGDFVKLLGISANHWAITEIGGIWVDEA